MKDNENQIGEIGIIKHQIAELLENTGKMLRNSDISTQSDDIRNGILEIESALHIFKKKSGISFEPLNVESQEKLEAPSRRLIGYKRLGETRAHKSSGFPQKKGSTLTVHRPESDDKSS